MASIFIKKIVRVILPFKGVRRFVNRCVPKLHKINTYLLKRDKLIQNLSPIDEKYMIREISWDDEEKLIKMHSVRGMRSYNSKIVKRLNSPEWIGLGVFDSTNGDIAYLAWVVTKSIPYFEEFGIKLKSNQFLLKDCYCIPHYRHQGLHSRMEQERINYCIRNGADEIFTQLFSKNKRGNESIIGNGFVLIQQNYLISWSIFGTFRALTGFLKNPFRKIVK